MKKNRHFSIDDHGYFNFVKEDWRCPICGRESDDTLNEHHLFPQVKGGKKKEKVTLHSMCHSKIHSVFTEWELNHYYHTIERIMENEDMQKFAKWMAKKPLGFKDSNKMTNRRNPRKNK